MRKRELRSKLAGIVSQLDEIINAETEQTAGLAAVRKCRRDLERALCSLNTRKGAVDPKALLLRIYRLIDCVYFFVAGKN